MSDVWQDTIRYPPPQTERPKRPQPAAISIVPIILVVNIAETDKSMVDWHMAPTRKLTKLFILRLKTVAFYFFIRYIILGR